MNKKQKAEVNAFYEMYKKEKGEKKMPDMNENAETQQEYFGKIRTDNTRTLHNALNKIAALEEKISILLSCKNCPENKGGLLCQKEYEDKCLAQKIQYIRELKEENENLKKTYRKQRNKRIDVLQKENAELKEDYKVLSCSVGDWDELQEKYEEEQRKNNELSDQLTNAKEIIKKLIALNRKEYIYSDVREEAEQFLSEVKK